MVRYWESFGIEEIEVVPEIRLFFLVLLLALCRRICKTLLYCFAIKRSSDIPTLDRDFEKHRKSEVGRQMMTSTRSQKEKNRHDSLDALFLKKNNEN